MWKRDQLKRIKRGVKQERLQVINEAERGEVCKALKLFITEGKGEEN